VFWLCALAVAGCGDELTDEEIEQDDVPNLDGQRQAMGACLNNGDYLPTLYRVEGSIEGYSPKQLQGTCAPQSRPGVRAFRDLVLQTYPCTGDGGIVRACNVGGNSEHKEGRAWDWMVSYPSAAATQLLSWLLAPDDSGNQHAMARRLGVMYMIWNRQAWRAYNTGAGWQPYYGKSPHTDHVHFSFGWHGASGKASFWSHTKHRICNQAVPEAAGELFKDMPAGSTGYQEAKKLYNAGITSGCQVSPTLFCAACPLTRAQMATLLVRSMLAFDPGSGSRFNGPAPSFGDVPQDHPHRAAIQNIAAAGVTLGCTPDGSKFCPEQPVTRGQMAAFLGRARQWQLVPGSQTFADVPSIHRFYREIETLHALGITSGCKSSPPAYCPDATLTRGQAAVFIARAFGL